MPLSMTTAGREVGSIGERKKQIMKVIVGDPRLRSDKRFKAMDHDGVGGGI